MALWITAAGVLAAAPEAKEWKSPGGLVVKYRWSAPAEIKKGEAYPLVLFLHGAGERGNDNSAQLKYGVLPMIEGAEKAGTPCFLIAPQCPADQWWSPLDRSTMRLAAAGKPNELMESVIALADQIMKDYPVDPKRFHVTGLSMGGYATWDLLTRIPDKIASAIPICGGGAPSMVARFKQVPVWAFHGEDDPVVPQKCTREMIEALEKAGGKPKATYYPDTGHDSWTRTYNDPDVIRWFFQLPAL